MKKLLVIFFCIVALGLGVYFSTKPSFLKPTVAPSPTPKISAQKPPLEIFPEEKNVTFQSESFPPTQAPLPIYSLTPITISLTDASSIAQNFGFVEKPLKIPNAPSTYQWNSGKAMFLFRENKESELFSFSQPDFSLYSKRISSASEGAMLLSSFFSPAFSFACPLSLEKTTSGPFDGVAYTGPLKGYYFSCLTPNKYPIVSSSFETTVATLITTTDGRIYSFSLLSPYEMSEIATKEVLTPQEALFNIKEGRGILFFVSNNGFFSYFEDSPRFTNVTFLSYSFYYYPSSDRLLIEPYYIFEGKTTSTNGDQLTVKYALPALIAD